MGSRPGRCTSSSSFITCPESPSLTRATLLPSCPGFRLPLFAHETIQADSRSKARPHGTRCAPALLLHPQNPHEAARGFSPSAPSQIPLQHPPECAAPKARGRSSSRSPAQSRLIASCLFFIAFEVRIPPTLPRARFCPVSHGGEPVSHAVVTQIQGRGWVAKPSPARVCWEQHPWGAAAVGTAPALPRAAVAGSGGILHSQHLLLRYLIPPEPGTARGAGAAGTDTGSGRAADAGSGRATSRLLTLALSLHPEELKPLERRSHCSSCA